MGATTWPSPPALPGAVAPRDAVEAQLVARAVQQLNATEQGRQVGEFLARSGVEIRVLPDEEYRAHYPGSGAAYDPRTRDIIVPRSQLFSPGMVTTLAHEGQHALDYSHRPPWYLEAVRIIAGSSGDAARSLVTFDNPLTAWLDSLTARQHEDEVVAYHLQAKVAHELGLNESAWSHGQARDGTPLPLDEVRASIAVDDLYRMSPMRRLLLGGGLGLTMTSVAALAGKGLASKLRPGSYLAAHSWPIYAVGGAMTGAWLIADQMRARRLERSMAQFN